MCEYVCAHTCTHLQIHIERHPQRARCRPGLTYPHAQSKEARAAHPCGAVVVVIGGRDESKTSF